MAARRLIIRIISIFIAGIFIQGIVLAQSPDLPVNTRVEGEVSAGQEQTWQINLADGAVYSLMVTTPDDALDPIITIYGINSRLVISNDDADFPDNTDALLEAFTVPNNGRYLVGVSGFDNSSGAYELLIQPGYAIRETDDVFSDADAWQVESILADEDSSSVDATFESDSLQITLNTPEAISVAWYEADSLSGAFYAAVDVEIDSASGWQTGFVLETDSGELIILELSHQGIWRTRLINDTTDNLISDWVSHPAIISGETAFNLALLITESHLTIFYKSQAAGDVIDARLDHISRVGIFTQNSRVSENMLIAHYENFYISSPLKETPDFPSQLPSGAPVDIISTLQNQRLLAPGGVQILDLADVPAQSLQPGITDFGLMRGQQLNDFVMGSRLSWQVNGNGTGGCGLIVRGQDDVNYTLAYADSSGGFGLSERRDNTFLDGIFVEALSATESPYELIIIGLGNRLHYYVEKQYLGFIDTENDTGTIGQAVVNFDGVNSSCRFQDTWLWSWE